MWSAIIVEKQFSLGVLRVNIVYTDGTEKFNEVVSLQNGEDLSLVVQNRLSQLEITKAFADNLVLDTFTPDVLKESPTSAVQSPSAVSRLAVLKAYLDMGLFDETDTEYQQTLKEAKSEIGR